MSGVDPECHPQPSLDADRVVCAECFADADLKARIEDCDGPCGCDFCGQDDAPTMPFNELAAFIGERLEMFYGKAGDQLPYESAEGGYQGSHSITWDVVSDEVSLPRDDGDLLEALVDEIGDDEWCDYDWLSLEPDESLRSSWEAFCQIVKHDRRFFFHNVGGGPHNHPDERSPFQLLHQLGRHVDAQGLIRTEDAGYRLFRARTRTRNERHDTAAALGPPPPTLATQSNRMNPPGISMFYGADDADLAVAEVRNRSASIGAFESLRPIRILDLADLPETSGMFSDCDRMDRFALAFLADFAELIVQPVPRNDRTQVDYIPAQVFTEFLRDFAFEGGPIDGVRYRSATGEPGLNVVLFATPNDVVDGSPDPEYGPAHTRWLRLVDVAHRDP